MKKRNKLILVQALVAIVVLLSTSVYAAISVKLELSASNTKLNPGDEVTVKLSIKDIAVSDEGVTNVDGYINYDENIIEPITVESIVRDSDGRVTVGKDKLSVEDLTGVTSVNTGDNTTGIVFNGKPATDNDCRLLIGLVTPLKEDTDLLTIKFKIKENATLGEVENAIRYDMFVITAGEEKTPAISEAIALTVEKVNDNNNGNNNDNDGNNNGNDNNNDGNNENGNNGNDNNGNGNSGDNNNGNAGSANNGSNNNNNDDKNVNNTANNVVNNTTNNTVNNTANNTVNNTSNKVDNTVSGTNLPRTGTRMLIIPIIAAIILAYVSYNRYIKYKNI